LIAPLSRMKREKKKKKLVFVFLWFLTKKLLGHYWLM
jgi:hypothetical protein